jgi:hypothetical protein
LVANQSGIASRISKFAFATVNAQFSKTPLSQRYRLLAMQHFLGCMGTRQWK